MGLQKHAEMAHGTYKGGLCLRGHEKVYQSGRGRCLVCRRASNGARYAKNPEHFRAKARDWYAKHRERLTANRKLHLVESRADSYKKNLKRNFGLTLEDYDRMLQAQEGRCVCGKTEGDRGYYRLHVDHDHDTGEVRGLLCGSCNRGIGLLGEDPKLLRLLADYLERRWP